jgi:hypothetical protein
LLRLPHQTHKPRCNNANKRWRAWEAVSSESLTNKAKAVS